MYIGVYVMNYLEFFEEYKKTDKLCRDMFGFEKGLSGYIDRMENDFGYRDDYDWREFLRTAKRIRYVRNQIAHEVNGASVFTYEDGERLYWVHGKLMQGRDPLGTLERARAARKANTTVREAVPKSAVTRVVSHAEIASGTRMELPKSSISRVVSHAEIAPGTRMKLPKSSIARVVAHAEPSRKKPKNPVKKKNRTSLLWVGLTVFVVTSAIALLIILAIYYLA